MRPLAIVPARGGSKRIPLKNIRPFSGVPIIARVVRILLDSGAVDGVVVSTDHPEIKRVAEEAGALVPFERSASNSDDHATLHQVMVEALDRLPETLRRDVLVCVLPTAALLEPGTIARAVSLFEQGSHDSMVSVQRFRHPIERALEVTEDGRLVMVPGGGVASRTQDLRPKFHDAGQFYVVRSDGLRDRRTLMGSTCLPFEVSEFEAHDIDDLEDWEVAEFKFAWKERRRGQD